jgi:dCMP deaminase
MNVNNEKQFLMDVAVLTSKRSKAIRAKVGGVITDSKLNLVAVGYNGSVSGLQDALEKKVYLHPECDFVQVDVDKEKYPYSDVINSITKHYRLETNEEIAIHAEQNMISHAARRGISIDGGTAVLTLSPCAKCTSLLIQSGIKEIIFLEKYRLHEKTQDLYGSYVKLTHWKHNHE